MICADLFANRFDWIFQFKQHGWGTTFNLTCQLASSNRIYFKLLQKTILAVVELDVDVTHEFLQNVNFFFILFKLQFEHDFGVLDHLSCGQGAHPIILGVNHHFGVIKSSNSELVLKLKFLWQVVDFSCDFVGQRESCLIKSLLKVFSQSLNLSINCYLGHPRFNQFFRILNSPQTFTPHIIHSLINRMSILKDFLLIVQNHLPLLG